jgi:hypothetical protein
LAVADLNGDGNLDLVSVNEDAGTVSVLLGNGDGTFQDAVSYATGGTPRAIAVGDLTGTGTLDLVVAGYLDSGVDVLLGNGDGSFGAPVHYDLNSNTDTVALGDFTGTGTLDILGGTQSGVARLPGNGDGTFAAPINHGTRGNAYAIAVDDFNGDGNLDFATVTGGNTVLVFLGNGDGTFQPVDQFATGSTARSVTSGDLNGDGFSDLVTASLTTPGSVSVLTNAADWSGPATPEGGHAAGLDARFAHDRVAGDGYRDEAQPPRPMSQECAPTSTDQPRLAANLEEPAFRVIATSTPEDAWMDVLPANPSQNAG